MYDPPHLKTMNRTYKPIIAALDGYCLAQAMFMAVLFCDIRIATPRVRMYSPTRTHTSNRLDRNWGSNLFRDTIGMPLWWYTGLGNLMYMSLTKKQIDAEEALRFGLINEIVPVEQLMDRAIELAKLISESPPAGVRVSKEFYRKNLQAVNGYDLNLRDGFSRCRDELIWHQTRREISVWGGAGELAGRVAELYPQGGGSWFLHALCWRSLCWQCTSIGATASAGGRRRGHVNAAAGPSSWPTISGIPRRWRKKLRRSTC